MRQCAAEKGGYYENNNICYRLMPTPDNVLTYSELEQIGFQQICKTASGKGAGGKYQGYLAQVQCLPIVPVINVLYHNHTRADKIGWGGGGWD